MEKATTSESALERLQHKIGYVFRNRLWLEQALRHPSFSQEPWQRLEHNQRLEFLGDAVLGAILAERLYYEFPREREGQLSRSRSILNRRAFLASLARDLGLPEALAMSPGEEAGGGRDRDSNLEDALEALIGAIYLDSDWHTVRGVVLLWYGDISQRLQALLSEENPKGKLQELAQPIFGNESVQYAITETSGPDHQRQFSVAVSVNGQWMGSGTGTSKKEAEEKAARAALRKWPELMRNQHT